VSDNWRDELKSKAGFVVMFILGCVWTVLFFAGTISAAINEGPAGFLFFLMLVAVFLLVRGAVGLGQVRRHNNEVEERHRREEAKRREERRKEMAAQQQTASKADQPAPVQFQTGLVQSQQADGSLSSFASGTTGELVFELDGLVTNILQVYEDRCILIAKTTARSYAAGAFFNGTKEFFYEDLTNVQFRESTKKFNGYLQFEHPGTVNVSASTFGGTGGNYNSENSFIFAPTTSCPGERIASDQELAATNQLVGSVYQYIHGRIMEEKQKKKNANGNVAVIQQISAADEIKKYQELLSCGAITQEEFDAKKKQLLGL